MIGPFKFVRAKFYYILWASKDVSCMMMLWISRPDPKRFWTVTKWTSTRGSDILWRIVWERDCPRERLSGRELVQERFSGRKIVRERDCPGKRLSERQILCNIQSISTLFFAIQRLGSFSYSFLIFPDRFSRFEKNPPYFPLDRASVQEFLCGFAWSKIVWGLHFYT